jgi:hypothetical protein
MNMRKIKKLLKQYPIPVSQAIAAAINAGVIALTGVDNALTEEQLATLVVVVQVLAGLTAQRYTRSKASLGIKPGRKGDRFDA